MDDAAIAGLLLLLVAAVGVSGQDDYQCPLGFEPTHCSSRKCKCMKNINGHLKCDEENQQLYLKIGRCISTYSDSDMTVVIGDCPYIHPSAKNSSILLSYFPLPPNMTASEVNGYMCGEMNRTGRLCGRCENGTGPSVFSPDLKCVRCLDSSYGWAVYLAAELIPITVFVLLIVLFRIRLCADYMIGLVFFCNITSGASIISHSSLLLVSSNSERIAASILLYTYSISNLQFFQNFLPPICISSEMTNLEAIALRYVVALYPLLLILLIYVLVWLYDRNFKPVVLVWRPFSALFTCFSETFDIQHSLIHAFASFFILSYFVFGVTNYALFLHVSVTEINSSSLPKALYWDGSVDNINNNGSVLLVIFMFTIFNFLPIVLMLVYPMRTFQKCLNCCGLRCLPLHIFMDAFQGCYKNGTEGTRDYRYFAGLYLLSRFSFWKLPGSLVPQSDCIFIFAFSFMFALCRPYKRNCFNVVDCLFHAVLALFISISYTSRTAGIALLMLLCAPLVYLLILLGRYVKQKHRKLQDSFLLHLPHML